MVGPAEQGFLDPRGDVLFLSRSESWGDHGSSASWGEFLQLSPLAKRPDTDGLWQELRPLIVRSLKAVQERSEVVLIGGFDHTAGGDRSVSWGTSTKGCNTVSMISASPRPGIDGWLRSSGSDSDRTMLTMSLSDCALADAASLAIAALREWQIDPWEILLTYITPIEALTA